METETDYAHMIADQNEYPNAISQTFCKNTVPCVFQACKEQVDAVLFLFSFTDRTSFDDLSNQIAKWTGTSVRHVVKLVIGTKYPLNVDFMKQFQSRAYFITTISIQRWSFVLNVSLRFDLFMHCDVPERDVRDFQETWNLRVLRVGGEVSDGLGDVAPLLNCLAENLWHQDCVTAGSANHQSQQETGTLH